MSSSHQHASSVSPRELRMNGAQSMIPRVDIRPEVSLDPLAQYLHENMAQGRVAAAPAMSASITLLKAGDDTAVAPGDSSAAVLLISIEQMNAVRDRLLDDAARLASTAAALDSWPACCTPGRNGTRVRHVATGRLVGNDVVQCGNNC
ncbi:hypothetical protein [Actinoplanes xinjiangensis]|uniref:hypothetical protein n=2 Tax=Actinoplanes xinjiangensis TaxID=512350 RepID=UPI001944EFFF|nr:hypothetical protein [Actinoplanes xinjiangensis]